VKTEHEAIARAVRTHDTAAALGLMDDHLRRTENAVARLPVEGGDIAGSFASPVWKAMSHQKTAPGLTPA